MAAIPLTALNAEDYQRLVEQAPILIWRSNTDGLCDYFNQRWLAFTGHSLEHELGDGWAQGVHPDDHARCMSTFLDAFHRREAFEMEYRLLRHDGAWRWILDRGGPSYGPDGQFRGYIGSCVDVSERVDAQEALARAREAQVKTLQGLLPICMICRKVRNDQGYWDSLEAYIREHSNADFTHGLCPECKPGYMRSLHEEMKDR